MSFIGDALGDVVGGITGAKQAGEAAQQAGQTQAGAAYAGIDEQKRQFDALIQLMQPYVQSGNQALTGQGDILGLNGTGAQQTAISGIQNSPYYQAMQQQGENAILQNASATGGLRGGNVQQALSQYSPQLLNQLIQQQFTNLGGLSQLGQASAAGQGAAGMNSANSIGNLLNQAGSATAGGIVGQGSTAQNAFKNTLGLAGTVGAFL